MNGGIEKATQSGQAYLGRTVLSNFVVSFASNIYADIDRLLDEAKRLDPELFTKSGMMVGLGETRNEVLQVMDDLRMAQVDFLTIGQYLQPTRKHAAVERFVTPDEFDDLRRIATAKGFLLVAATPLTRSSYHAGDDFARLRQERQKLQ